MISLVIICVTHNDCIGHLLLGCPSPSTGRMAAMADPPVKRFMALVILPIILGLGSYTGFNTMPVGSTASYDISLGFAGFSMAGSMVYANIFIGCGSDDHCCL